MKRAIYLLALCAACTDDAPSGGGITGTTHVESYFLPALATPRLDLLFVVDDTTAMAAHQQALAALPAQIDQMINGAYGVPASYQLGVVTTDAASGGVLRRDATINGPFIVHDTTYTGPKSNYQDSLADALTKLWPSSAASNASNQPLATMRAALDGNPMNTGFVRDEAYLGIVTISASDDASLAAVDDYVSFARGVTYDAYQVIVSAVIPASASRLTAFHAQFPNRSAVQSIDTTDYAGAFSIFTQLYKTTLGYACNKEPADLDPVLPGPQYDCSFVWIEDAVEHRLPPCRGGDAEPCWEIVMADPTICFTPDERAHLQTRGFTMSPSMYGDPFHPEVRGQCIVN